MYLSLNLGQLNKRVMLLRVTYAPDLERALSFKRDNHLENLIKRVIVNSFSPLHDAVNVTQNKTNRPVFTAHTTLLLFLLHYTLLSTVFL